MSRIHNGTCGTGGLGIKPYVELANACTGINFIELDNTFYMRSREKNEYTLLEKEASKFLKTPKRFRITAKVSEDITHEFRLNIHGRRLIKSCVKPLVKTLGKKYVGPVFQMPKSFEYNTVNLQRLEKTAKRCERIKSKDGPFNYILCLRSKSWYNEKIIREIISYGWNVAIVVSTGSWLNPVYDHEYLWKQHFLYFRLHGSEGKYRGYYNKKELHKIIFSYRVPRVIFAAFNNTSWGDSARVHCKYSGRERCAICNAVDFAGCHVDQGDESP